MQPAPPLNASYTPLTILAPTQQPTITFLEDAGINLRTLASSPLQSVLLAPSLGAHFVRGYFPATALPSELAEASLICRARGTLAHIVYSLAARLI